VKRDFGTSSQQIVTIPAFSGVYAFKHTLNAAENGRVKNHEPIDSQVSSLVG
jgi:hypothetical protein